MKKILSVFLSALLMFSLLQIATLAEDAPVALTFADQKLIDITVPKSAKFTAPESLEKAEFYIENALVHTVLGDGSGEYDINLDLQNAPVLGETEIVIKAYCPEIITTRVPVKLVRYKTEASVFAENFNTFTSGKWPQTVHGYIESEGGSEINIMGPHTVSEGNNALKVTFPSIYNKSSTYMEKDNIGLSNSCIAIIKFDAYFSTDSEYMRVELRDSNGGYPQYGGAGMGSVALFGTGSALYGGEKTYAPGIWYSVLMEVDLTTLATQNTQGAWIYIKGGEFEEYTLLSYLPGFSCNGLKKIRFTCSSAGGNDGYILIDNFEITKKEFEQRWYYTAEFEDESGNSTAFDAVKTQGAKINLKFSEDMGENLNGKVLLENEMGDKISFTGSYDSALKRYTLNVTDTLLNGGKYFVKVAEGVLSAAGNEANSTLGAPFYAEKHPVCVKSVSYSSGTAVVEMDNIDKIESGMALILVSYSNDKCTDSNVVLLNGDSEQYTVNITRGSGERIEAFIVDGFDTLKILSTYSY